jgi:hypothetical protein
MHIINPCKIITYRSVVSASYISVKYKSIMPGRISYPTSFTFSKIALANEIPDSAVISSSSNFAS